MRVCSEVQVPTGGCFGLTRKGADKFVHEVVSQSDAAPARHPGVRTYISWGYALAQRPTDEHDETTASELMWEYIHQPRHRTLVDFLRSFCREKNIDYDERFQANDDAWNDVCGRTSSNNSRRTRQSWYDEIKDTSQARRLRDYFNKTDFEVKKLAAMDKIKRWLAGRHASFSKLAAVSSSSKSSMNSFPKDAEFFAAIHDFVQTEEGNQCMRQ